MKILRRHGLALASTRLLSWLALSILLYPASVAAGTGPSQPPNEATVLVAAGPGQKVTAPDLASPAELVLLDQRLIPQLLKVAPGGTVRVESWPVAPEVRAEVVLSRYDIYAPDAHIYKVDGATWSEVERSRHVFFRGTEAADSQAGIVVAVDPESRTLESFTTSARGVHAMKSLVPGKPGLHLVAAAEAFQARGPKDEKPSWMCGQEDLPFFQPHLQSPAKPGATGKRLEAVVLASALRTATVAVDTDNALMSQKFSDNTATATNYIANLFAAINVMYQRDLQVQLLQGTTFLRVSSTPDPYIAASGGSADPTHLADFGSYWMTHFSNVPRTVAAMLSGKSPSPFGASGIAYINALCDTGETFGTVFFGGYSFSQVFLSDQLPLDAMIVGHEIGHNFGSPHTHCYSPPIDTCWNLEACYSGPTSCPAPSTVNGVPNVEGTIMGYCHLRSDGCTTSQVFHPRTVALVEPSIQSALGVCMSQAVTPPSISSVAPGSGPAAGNASVTIGGSGFQQGASVSLGGVNAGIVSITGNTIVATTGAHATGTVAVVVTNPDSTMATLPASYFYDAPPAGHKFFTLPPCRLIDTRTGSGPLAGPNLAAGASRLFTVPGTCGIPAGAKSLSANLSVVTPGAAGILTLYPGNAFAMETSAISFSSGQTRGNNSIIELATDGSGTFGVMNRSPQSTPFVVDVNGYFQ